MSKEELVIKSMPKWVLMMGLWRRTMFALKKVQLGNGNKGVGRGEIDMGPGCRRYGRASLRLIISLIIKARLKFASL